MVIRSVIHLQLTCCHEELLDYVIAGSSLLYFRTGSSYTSVQQSWMCMVHKQGTVGTFSGPLSVN